ncbi:MAG TPA: hypothetical protein VM575_17665, partial [Nocardioides sp.]|nr:hypothetical protein [Nocardioides sp.]
GRAVRWARVNVGEQGRPPRADRPSTWRELVPDHLPDVRGLVVDDLPQSIVDHQWSYALAPERRLTCRLELATPLDGDAVASALDLLRRRLVDGIVGQVVDAGGRVTFGEGTCTTAYAGQVHGLARTTAGRFSANDGDRPAWERTLKRIRADELVEAQVVFAVADGTGACDSGARLGAVTVSWSSPDARGHHRPVISVEVGEVFRGIAPADVVEVLREASAGLPVSAGHVDVGRFSADRSVGRWGTLRPLRPALDTTVFAEVEPWPSTATSDLVLARATPEPEELTLLARDAVSAAWGEQPLDIADVVRRGP